MPAEFEAQFKQAAGSHEKKEFELYEWAGIVFGSLCCCCCLCLSSSCWPLERASTQLWVGTGRNDGCRLRNVGAFSCWVKCFSVGQVLVTGGAYFPEVFHSLAACSLPVSSSLSEAQPAADEDDLVEGLRSTSGCFGSRCFPFGKGRAKSLEMTHPLQHAKQLMVWNDQP